MLCYAMPDLAGVWRPQMSALKRTEKSDGTAAGKRVNMQKPRNDSDRAMTH